MSPMPLLACCILALTPQQPQNWGNELIEEMLENSKKVERLLSEIVAYQEVVNLRLESLEALPRKDELLERKLREFHETNQTVQERVDHLEGEMTQLLSEVDQLVKDLNDGEDGLRPKVRALETRLGAIERQLKDVAPTIVRREEQLASFRLFTRLTVVRTQRSPTGSRLHTVGLTADEGGMKVPLAGRPVLAHRRSLDGPPTLIDEAVTDEAGMVKFEFRARDWPKRTSILYQFPGDATHRESEASIKVK